MRYNFEIDQLSDTINLLKRDPLSRQAAIVYRDPFGDRENINTKDRACNIATTFSLRDGKLNLAQLVRSHDLVWGVPYNWIQFGYIAQVISEQLDVKVGSYTELCSNLHVYAPFYNDIYKIVMMKGSNSDYTMPMIGNVNYKLLKNVCFDNFLSLEFDNSLNIISEFRDSPFWSKALLVLFSYEYRKEPKIAMGILDLLDKDDIFRKLTIRYYQTYWKKYWGEINGI